MIGFDFLLYEAILLSNKYKGPKIEIRENVDLGVEVEDGGLLSTFLQDIIGNMRIQSDFDHTIDFNQCQPNGQKPGYVPIIGEFSCKYVLRLCTKVATLCEEKPQCLICGKYNITITFPIVVYITQ